jgi:hypothetical protein
MTPNAHVHPGRPRCDPSIHRNSCLAGVGCNVMLGRPLGSCAGLIFRPRRLAWVQGHMEMLRAVDLAQASSGGLRRCTIRGTE